MLCRQIGILWAIWATAGMAAITTSASPEEVAQAVAYDASFISYFLLDFDFNNDRYTSYMKDNGLKYPQTLIQYIVDQQGQTDLTKALDAFPFTQFRTYITAFPWYNSLLGKGSITEFKVPGDFTAAPEASAVPVVEATPSATVSDTVTFTSNNLNSQARSSEGSSSTRPTNSVSLRSSSSKNQGNRLEVAAILGFVYFL